MRGFRSEVGLKLTALGILAPLIPTFSPQGEGAFFVGFFIYDRKSLKLKRSPIRAHTVGSLYIRESKNAWLYNIYYYQAINGRLIWAK